MPEYSLAALLQIAIARRRTLIVASVGCALVSALLLLMQPRTYSSLSSFAPQGSKQGTQFSGIAAQLGVALPGQDLSSSPQFYADLAKSRTILRGLVDSLRITDPVGTSTTVSDAYNVKGSDTAMRREATVDRLVGSIAVTAVQRTGVVQLNVRAPHRDIALQINTALLASVNGFNLHRRQSQASAERSFIERRLAEGRAELRAAENKLQAFMQDNRTYAGSPALQFRYDRLQADVSLHQSVVSTLAQLYEQSRVDEVRDTPVITVIEPPTAPARPDRRNLLTNTVFAGVAGFLVSLLLVVGSVYWRAARKPVVVVAP